jgi:hypothetical protein
MACRAIARSPSMMSWEAFGRPTTAALRETCRARCHGPLRAKLGRVHAMNLSLSSPASDVGGGGREQSSTVGESSLFAGCSHTANELPTAVQRCKLVPSAAGFAGNGRAGLTFHSDKTPLALASSPLCKRRHRFLTNKDAVKLSGITPSME